jgi:hypothetical protein
MENHANQPAPGWIVEIIDNKIDSKDWEKSLDIKDWERSLKLPSDPWCQRITK